MPMQSPVVVITIAAIWINTIGISYNYAIFAYCGLNYADFADVDDFLVAGFKNILVLLYAIFSTMFFFWISRTRQIIYPHPISMKLFIAFITF
jgi:hypothetical protein